VRYFEDMPVGRRFDIGRASFDEPEIVDFALRFDPQPFHVDAEAARASSFGGLVASGAHTFAVFIRMFVETVLLDAASAGSPGIDELRWLRPVRPGDTLHGSYTVVDTRASVSRPQWGIVTGLGEAVDQEGRAALSMTLINMIERRPLRAARL
jgi:acyl dehydratase